MRRRAVLALLPALVPAACGGLPTGEAAYLAHDGEHAAGRLIADVTLAERRVDRARDLLLLRAALAAPPGTTAEALRARPETQAAEARLAAAAEVLARGRDALESLRDGYRAFGHVAAGRDPEQFDALLDRAVKDAEALRTVIERHATEGTYLVESLPGGEALAGVARLAGGLASRARASRDLLEPNAEMIALLDSLIAAAEREAATLGPVLAEVARDRGEDVAAALRRAGMARLPQAETLDRLGESFGWPISNVADQRLRDGTGRRIALGLEAIAARQAAQEPARLTTPEALRDVLLALRDRHLALRGQGLRDPQALRDSLHRLAR
jgi:hypothetical protein